jgi:hypothetical protein
MHRTTVGVRRNGAASAKRALSFGAQPRSERTEKARSVQGQIVRWPSTREHEVVGTHSRLVIPVLGWKGGASVIVKYYVDETLTLIPEPATIADRIKPLLPRQQMERRFWSIQNHLLFAPDSPIESQCCAFRRTGGLQWLITRIQLRLLFA